jgi:hypothetical protein
VCTKNTLFDVETAILHFQEGIRDMFATFPEVSYADSSFFPSTFRNPIMQAGRTQTLLKMIYKGSERMVEPYALRYKMPQGKPSREYLFVYELTGGSKGEPGVRSYVAENVQSVADTDIKFSPRDGNEIELCKAGEPVDDKYFGDPNRPKAIRASRRSVRTHISRTAPAGPKYTYPCTACSRTITKRKMNSTIGPQEQIWWTMLRPIRNSDSNQVLVMETSGERIAVYIDGSNFYQRLKEAGVTRGTKFNYTAFISRMRMVTARSQDIL